MHIFSAVPCKSLIRQFKYYNSWDPVLCSSIWEWCNECGAAFYWKSNLNRHIESVHEERKSFKCADCGKAFSHKHTLNGHIESVHEGKKPFKCNICDASFTSKMSFLSAVHEVKMAVDRRTAGICKKAVIVRKNQT